MKHRIPDSRWGGPIADALRITSPWAHLLEDVRFFAGVDPVFAGLHSFVDSGTGYKLAETPHCCYDYHLPSRPKDERVTTIVLPRPVHAGDIIHELGHAIHCKLGFKPSPVAVSEYGKTNRNEAFAEYFVAHLLHYGDQDAYRKDDTRLLLDALASS